MKRSSIPPLHYQDTPAYQTDTAHNFSISPIIVNLVHGLKSLIYSTNKKLELNQFKVEIDMRYFIISFTISDRKRSFDYLS